MRSGLRLVAMWVGLIALFVAFYGFFRQPGDPLPDLSRWIPTLLVLALAVIVGVVIGRRNQKGWQLNAEGNTLLSRGHIAAALEKFEAARSLLKNQGHGIIPFNTGVCHLELWQLDAAERDFTTAQGIKPLPVDVRKHIPARLALISALQGALSVADKRLAEAKEESPGDPLIVLVQGVIACRREDWAQARALLEGPSTHVLGGPKRGLRDALLSWSVERLTGERRYVDPITVFGEASTDKLRECWPALAHFLVERARQAV
jgi:tetratricopeptide (TPR) repeat protein